MAKSIHSSIFFNQCDPAGILFFAEVFTLCHNAYEELIQQNAKINIFDHPTLAFPIVNTQADYRSPLTRGSVDIEMACDEIGNSSYTISYRIVQKEKLCSTVKITHVSIDKKKQKASPLPDELRRWLETDFS